MWKQISNNYSINENGEVRNDITGKIKSTYVNKRNNYVYVDLWENNKAKKRTIHRLLAEAFIPNPDNKPTIDHIDGNRENNSIDNLRWATYSEQNSRFDTVGVRANKVKVSHFSNKDGKRIIDRVICFNMISDAAKHFDVSISNISMMLKNGQIGKRGKMRDYLFEYDGCNRVTFHERVTTIETAAKAETE